MIVANDDIGIIFEPNRIHAIIGPNGAGKTTFTNVLTGLLPASAGQIVCGGEDKVVKFWDYDEGLAHYQGVGHSGGITKIAIAPNQQFFVSTGTEGGIFIWKMPAEAHKGK